MKSYRIGEFARLLGVTPDFLKYYEKAGLLTSQPGENNQRFYTFDQSARVIECIKMRNLGFSARETLSLTTQGSLDQWRNRLARRMEELRRDACFRAEVLRLWNRDLPCLENLAPFANWSVAPEPGYYFLPHAQGAVFHQDHRLESVTEDWMDKLPAVISALCIPESGPASWGLMATEEFARAMALPVETPVRYIPPARCLTFYVKADIPHRPENLPAGQLAMDPMQPVRPLLVRHNLQRVGPAFACVITKREEGGSRYAVHRMIVPIG